MRIMLPFGVEVFVTFNDNLIIGKISDYEYFDGRLVKYELTDDDGNKIWVLADAVDIWEP